jgi:hypothetical protein
MITSAKRPEHVGPEAGPPGAKDALLLCLVGLLVFRPWFFFAPVRPVSRAPQGRGPGRAFCSGRARSVPRLLGPGPLWGAPVAPETRRAGCGVGASGGSAFPSVAFFGGAGPCSSSSALCALCLARC